MTEESKTKNQNRIDLAHPILMEGDGGSEIKIDHVVLRRVKAKDLKHMPDEIFEGVTMNPHKLIPLIASLTNFPEDTIEEIDIEDLLAIADRLMDFLAPSQTTGK